MDEAILLLVPYNWALWVLCVCMIVSVCCVCSHIKCPLLWMWVSCGGTRWDAINSLPLTPSLYNTTISAPKRPEHPPYLIIIILHSAGACLEEDSPPVLLRHRRGWHRRTRRAPSAGKCYIYILHMQRVDAFQGSKCPTSEMHAPAAALYLVYIG
jgi:hypothetical protein